MDSDRDILIAAFESAARAYRDKHPQRALLGSDPDSTILDPICAAIRRCAAFKTVAGHMVYSGGAGPVLDAPLLAVQLFEKGERWGQDIPGAVEWLLRVLTTREALGLLKGAIWGLSVDQEATLSNSYRLMSFAALPDSYMKGSILARSKPCYDGSAWMTHTYFDVPRAAFVREVPKFPYIGADGACFEEIARLQGEARDLWVFIQCASIGHPLAIGCWFEYADGDLDIAQWQNPIGWMLPEIHPHIAACTSGDVAAMQDDLRKYAVLPVELRSDLLRSMNRFTLSQCRHQMIDRILDLVLAFEIAVSGGSDRAPPSYKVSVRSAQLIGGALRARQSNRDQISDLYNLRSKATHGSSLTSRDRVEQEELLVQCSGIYRDLLRSILLLGGKPDWNALELEPRTG
jgi:Apea-like HEPN